MRYTSTPGRAFWWYCERCSDGRHEMDGPVPRTLLERVEDLETKVSNHGWDLSRHEDILDRLTSDREE
jgi:hypothetical protein